MSVVGFDNTFRQIWYRCPRIPGGNISLALDQTIAATTVKRMAYVLQISFYCRIHVCDSSVSHPRCGKDDEQRCYIYYYAMAKSLQRQKAASEVTSVVSHSCLTREEKKNQSHTFGEAIHQRQTRSGVVGNEGGRSIMAESQPTLR